MVTINSANNKTATSGKVLQGQGVGTASDFSTATYPSSTTINRILYSSAANTISELATANSGVLSTSSSGVPSIDTTNFTALSTGLQLKGNNTNTAPPAGFIGEQIRSAVGPTSPGDGSTVNLTSISLTAGIWDVTALLNAQFTGTASIANLMISLNSASFTGNVLGDNYTLGTPVSIGYISLDIPSYRITLSSTTTIYCVIQVSYTTGTTNCSGRLSATRVG